MSLDKFFGRRYDKRLYNCAHLVVDVWRELKGEGFAEVFAGFLHGPTKRRCVKSDLRRITVLPKPVDPCVVFLQRPGDPAHVGVFTRGKVLHITPSGVQFQPLDIVRLGFTRVRFLSC